MSAPAGGTGAGEQKAVVTFRDQWTRKHKRRLRHAHEHNQDPAWYKHSKHILICSWSGRPVFTLYGDETKMAAYMGVITAIISNFQRFGDTVRLITAGDTRFVFQLIGPFYLVAISRTKEPVSTLRRQLCYVHSQIISLLTANVHSILETRPQYDVRQLMGGAETLLADLIDEATLSPSLFLESYPVLRLPRATRQRLTGLLKKAKGKSLVYAFLFGGKRLAALHRAKDRQLHPSDMILLTNFVTNSQSLRSSESWTPICLPKFSDKGFLYAYVCYLREDVCLTMITGAADDFYNMQQAKATIVEGLSSPSGSSPRATSLLEELVERSRGDVELAVDEAETGVAELRHFLYKAEPLQQYITAIPAPPFSTGKAQRQLARKYQHIHYRMDDGKGGKRYTLYFDVSDAAAVLVWVRPGEFELYATFLPLVGKDAAILAANRLLKWIKKEEANLFVAT